MIGIMGFGRGLVRTGPGARRTDGKWRRADDRRLGGDGNWRVWRGQAKRRIYCRGLMGSGCGARTRSDGAATRRISARACPADPGLLEVAVDGVAQAADQR